MVILDKIGRRQAKEIGIEVAVEEVELMRQCDGLNPLLCKMVHTVFYLVYR